MTLKELADASLRYSDNTAQNLILKQLGNLANSKITERNRDTVTNPERFEPELNKVHPGDVHDTSTPKGISY